MDEERLFDKAAADAVLPELQPLLERLRHLAGDPGVVADRDRFAEKASGNGSRHAAEPVVEQEQAIRSILARIETLGVILRDVTTGLCDFPAVREGEDVYLCWRLDEGAVGWWHPRDTGVAGRRPL